MSNLEHINLKDLELIVKAAIFLRDKLSDVGRDGPLEKLLSREIELINGEISFRRHSDAAEQKSSAPNNS
jgi:hypothetical protein